MSQPVIMFVDDEPHNIAVFEAALPENWVVRSFDNPLEAVDQLEAVQPWVVVSDQRMPGMKGVKFLELVGRLLPNTVRILVTGYTDEDLIIESVRAAKIFDYIRKPWEVDELVKRLEAAINHHESIVKRETLEKQLRAREQELSEANSQLVQKSIALERSLKQLEDASKELSCWIPPFVRWAIEEKSISFPITKDIVGITFDIISSSQMHGAKISGKPLRGQVIQLFSEAIIRHGGWRESHSGDSAYGHFGLLNNDENPYDSALAVAREFRVGIRSLANLSGHAIECGIALHVAKNCLVDIHTVQLNTPRGLVTQKSFDTTSSDIDLLHRMEKLVHGLPGSNIVMSQSFAENLKSPPPNIVPAGSFTFAGQTQPVELRMIPSDLIKPEDFPQALEACFAKERGKLPKAA